MTRPTNRPPVNSKELRLLKELGTLGVPSRAPLPVGLAGSRPALVLKVRTSRAGGEA